MSFLSALGKIGKIGGLVAAPFTGGASLALSALGTAGEVAGNMGAARAEGRSREAAQNLAVAGQKDRAALERADLDLARRRYADNERRNAMSEIMRGDILANMKRTPVQGPAGVPVVNFTGGLNADRITDTTRQGGSEMSRQAMLRLMNGPEFSDVPMQDYDSMVPQANLFDKILNGTSYAGTVAGMANAFRPKPTVPAGNAVPQAAVNGVFKKVQF